MHHRHAPQWDFNGDGLIDSVVQNPMFTYFKAGAYTVSLTVSNEFGEHTATKESGVLALPRSAEGEGEGEEETGCVGGVTIPSSPRSGDGGTNLLFGITAGVLGLLHARRRTEEKGALLG